MGYELFEMLGIYLVMKYVVKFFIYLVVKELVKYNIIVNVYCFGVVKMKMWDRIDVEMVKYKDLRMLLIW